MNRSEMLCYDLSDLDQAAALRDRHGLHAVTGKANRVFVHPQVRALTGSLNFGGEGNEIIFGEGCTFAGEIVSMGHGGTTILRGHGHHLSLQAFVYSGATLDIGPHVTAYGVRTWVSENKSLRIGEGCLFSEGISIRTTDHHSIVDLDTRTLLNEPASVAIEDRVWIGQDVAILKGVRIGRGAIVGAKALVNRSIPPMELWSGAPARLLRQRVTWLDPHPATPEQIHARLDELAISPASGADEV